MLEVQLAFVASSTGARFGHGFASLKFWFRCKFGFGLGGFGGRRRGVEEITPSAAR